MRVWRASVVVQNVHLTPTCLSYRNLNENQITKTEKIKAMSKKQLRQIKKTQVRRVGFGLWMDVLMDLGGRLDSDGCTHTHTYTPPRS